MWLPNSFATIDITPVLSHPVEYTTPVIRFVKSQNNHPPYHGNTLYIAPTEKNAPSDKCFGGSNVITGDVVYIVVYGILLDMPQRICSRIHTRAVEQSRSAEKHSRWLDLRYYVHTTATLGACGWAAVLMSTVMIAFFFEYSYVFLGNYSLT